MRTTDTTTIEIKDGNDKGLVQAWRYADFQVVVLAGEDDARVDAMRAASDALEGLPLLVQLDAEASYAGILNLDDVSARFASAMRPVLVATTRAAMAEKLGPEAEEAALERGMAEVTPRLDEMLGRIAAPAMLEASLKRQLDTFNAFTGVELEPGQGYEASVELENPLGQTPIPARIEFALFLPNAHPGHGLVEWTSTIDPERGLQAVWEIAEALTGEALPAGSREGLPDGLQMSDEGFFLFDLATGIPEMVEMERSVTFSDRTKYDRDRMRLVNGEHVHEWADEVVEAGEAAK